MDPENNYTNSLFMSDENSRILYNNDCGNALHAIQNNFSENEDIEAMEINLADIDNGKAKSFWSYNKTVSLIHAVEAHYDELNHAKKRNHMWDNVSNELVSLDNRKATGRGTMKFQFFEAMDGFMGGKPNINSPHAVNVSSFIDNNQNVPADKEDDTESSATDGNAENNNEIMSTSRQLAKKNKYPTIKAQYLQGKIEYKKQKLLLQERKVNALEELVALRKMK
ncbi:hypothetical protein QE152_g9762 [Popillia japonica]|uniref:MADF domain-containing protein n=1 Tax=Popillia japonica TaxID=7064 RepID=A0AAW1LX90_POPJA